MSTYFITPKYSVALIPKNGCSTIAREIIKNFQPDDENNVVNGHYPEGKGHHTAQLQWLAKKEPVASKQILAFIRDPYERFLSAMNQLRYDDVEKIISTLENGTKILKFNSPTESKEITLKHNIHFKHQYTWLNETSKLYKFPDHINEGAVEIGFSLPIFMINVSKKEKPQPTQDQKNRILAYYAKDKELFDKISSSGIIFNDILDSSWLNN